MEPTYANIPNIKPKRKGNAKTNDVMYNSKLNYIATPDVLVKEINTSESNDDGCLVIVQNDNAILVDDISAVAQSDYHLSESDKLLDNSITEFNETQGISYSSIQQEETEIIKNVVLLSSEELIETLSDTESLNVLFEETNAKLTGVNTSVNIQNPSFDNVDFTYSNELGDKSRKYESSSTPLINDKFKELKHDEYSTQQTVTTQDMDEHLDSTDSVKDENIKEVLSTVTPPNIRDKDSALTYINYVSTLLDSLKDSLINRSNLLLAANGVIIGILTFVLTSEAIKWAYSDIFAIFMLCVTFFFMLMSLYYALFVIRVFIPKKINTKELMHFRVILKLGEEEIKKFVKELNQEDLINEFINQIFALSRHIEKRYEYLYKGFWFFIACLISFFITIIYISITPTVLVELFEGFIQVSRSFIENIMNK